MLNNGVWRFRMAVDKIKLSVEEEDRAVEE